MENKIMKLIDILSEETLSQSQMAYLSKRIKIKKGDRIVWDREFYGGKISKDEVGNVVLVKGHEITVGPDMIILDLRSTPVKKINNNTFSVNEAAKKDSSLKEGFQKDGHIYNHESVGTNKDIAWAGKDGILGSNGVFISWQDVRMLQRKYRGRQ